MQNPTTYVQCPHCRALQAVSPTVTNQTVVCPVCRNPFVIPAATSTPPTTPAPYPHAASPLGPAPAASFSPTPFVDPQPTFAENEPPPAPARRGMALELIFLLTFLALFATAAIVIFMVVGKKRIGGGADMAEVEEEIFDADLTPQTFDNPHWSDARRFTLRKNDVKTKIREVVYGPVRTRDDARRVVEDEEKKFLVISLSLRNTSDTPRPYRSWYGSLFRVGGRQRSAELVDDLGNAYALHKFTGATAVQGHVPEATLVRSEQTRDAIVFALPDQIDRADVAWFHLELPAGAYGGEGVLRFEIPVDMIQGW